MALEAFGVGGYFRPGNFIGIRLQLTSNLTEAVGAQVVWEVPEGLGDIAEHMRTITLTPGQPLGVWLYARTTPRINRSTLFSARVYLDEDGKRGRELGSIAMSPATAMAPAQEVDYAVGMVGFIGGNQTAGLDHYNVSRSQMGGFPITTHEFTQTVAGLSVADLPDRWEGLDQFDALVWTDAPPGELAKRENTARALRDYINRGGHLIIILSSAGNDWGIGAPATTPISDLLPQTLPETSEVKLSELLPIFSKREKISERDDQAVPIRFFETIDNYYSPHIAMAKPDGRVVAIQRLVGHGRITVMGFELSSGQMTALMRPSSNQGGGIIEADTIWNRILGRRADTLHPTQIKTLDDESRLYRSTRRSLSLGSGNLIIDQIQLSGGALAGIGFAVLLFLFYWLAAGPLGWLALKSSGLVRHAWVIFALTGIVFTLVAWGGVKIFGRKKVQIQHLTFLDYVVPTEGITPPDSAGLQRATSWFTVFLPGYGEPRLSIESDPGIRNLLSPFSAPSVEQTRFRNVDRYVVPTNSPADYEVPARSTTKELVARWMGTVDESWGSIIEVTAPIFVTRRGGMSGVIQGKLNHNLPAALDDVHVMIVYPDRTQMIRYSDGTGDDPYLSAGTSGRMTNPGTIWELSTAWQPLTEIDLSETLVGAGSPLLRYFDSLGDRIINFEDQNFGSLTQGQREAYMEALSFYNQLPPPRYSKLENEVRTDSYLGINRHLGRELDLSAWLTRPCLIIYGTLREAEMPVPFRVNGDATASQGTTIVRWVYPLPVDIDDVAPEPLRVEEDDSAVDNE